MKPANGIIGPENGYFLKKRCIEINREEF